jgi:hypothetical protein
VGCQQALRLQWHYTSLQDVAAEDSVNQGTPWLWDEAQATLK